MFILHFCTFLNPQVDAGSLPIFDFHGPFENDVKAFLAGPAVVRDVVFSKGQNRDPLTEIDDQDRISVHIYATTTDKLPIGTARAFMIDDKTCRIGRVGVMEQYRGKGLGVTILDRIESEAKKVFALQRFMLHAQKDKIGFYEKNGYMLDEIAGEWMEKGKLHVRMYKNYG